MKPKKKTIRQTGYTIRGNATINCWGGGRGQIEMDKTFIPFKKLNKDNLLGCINDGRFGCQSIENAEVEVYIKYDNGSEEYDRSIYVTHKPHLQLACKGIQ